MILITVGMNAIPAFVENAKSYVGHFCDSLSRDTGYKVEYCFDNKIRGFNVKFRFLNESGVKIGEASQILKKIERSFLKGAK